MSHFANQPYNILPPLPPRADLETPGILKAAIAANRSLAELKGKAEGRELIGDLLENLAIYAQTEDGPDPLIKMAVIHYQFEAIHPFEDGNGRTGRILNILYLIRQQLLHQPVLYLSDYIISLKPDYYRLLREVTEKEAWEPWIIFMLEAVQITAEHPGHCV
ncbi:MAG: Fic family protein [Balneolaceae bacterium]